MELNGVSFLGSGATPELDTGAKGPSAAMSFLADIAPAAITAAIFFGVTAVGVRLDAAMNRDIIDTLKTNWEWWRMFTTKHGTTVLSEMYPWVVEGVSAAMGALYGYLNFGGRR